MTPDSLLATIANTEVTLSLLCSVIAGASIGLEREYQGKPAGLRTHTLVCFASALMTLVGLRTEEWATQLPANVQIVTDMARMPHAILTGIGFLGAGVIFREGASVQGLTTAASLWLSAALGIVFGAGLLELGTIGTVTALAVLILLRVLQGIAPPKPQVRLEIAVRADGDFDGARLRAFLVSESLRPGPLSIVEDRESGLRRYALLVSAQGAVIDAEQLASRFHGDQEVQEFSIVPLEHGVAA